MSRSIKKGPYVAESLMKKITALNEANDKKVVKTWSRSSTIFPDFVGHTIAVHDGRKHPVTKWGKCAMGAKTRRKKASDKLIVKGRTK